MITVKLEKVKFNKLKGKSDLLARLLRSMLEFVVDDVVKTLAWR
jgi:hypothetical protein